MKFHKSRKAGRDWAMEDTTNLCVLFPVEFGADLKYLSSGMPR